MANESGDFKWQGTVYAQHSSSQFDRALKALEKIELKASDQILDIGCGDGKITFLMAEKVPQGNVVGLDKDSSMIETAKQHELKVKNLHFIQADAKDFQLSQKFDLITSFFCLQWLSESMLKDAFKNIYKYLKENGKICIMLPCYDFPHEIVKGVAFSDKWKEYFQTYTELQTFLNMSSYSTILEGVGFENAEVVLVESSHPLTNQGFIKFTSQWCGCFSCLKDQKLQEEFIQDILTKLDLQPHNNKEEFNMIQKSIRMIAKKPSPKLSQHPTVETFYKTQNEVEVEVEQLNQATPQSTL
jgi:trans-aconitate 2-methyltransferase